MKLSRILSAALILTAVLLTSVAPTSPVSAFGAFTLGPGQYTPEGIATTGKIKQALWQEMFLEVDSAGNLSGHVRTNITNSDDLGQGVKWVDVSTLDVTVNGKYDVENGTFAGTLEGTREMNYVKTSPNGGHTRVGGDTWSGSFTGVVVNPRLVRLTFTYTEAYSFHQVNANGKESDEGQTLPGVQMIVDFPSVNADLPAKTEEKTFEDSGARFSDLSGQVEWRPNNDEEAWQFAKLGDVLPVDAHIRTSDRSGAIISFADMTTFVLKPESEIVLSSPAAKDSQFDLLVGNLWANVKKMARDGSMEIEMSQAVAGIKGTTFVLVETGDTSTIKVIEGTVQFTSKANGNSVSVGADEMVTASANGLSEKTTFDVDAESASWENAGRSRPLPLLPIGIGVGITLLVYIGSITFLALRKKK